MKIEITSQMQARWNVFKATGTMPGSLNLLGLCIVLNPNFEASLRDIWTLGENEIFSWLFTLIKIGKDTNC